jgi:hypothetical protein
MTGQHQQDFYSQLDAEFGSRSIPVPHPHQQSVVHFIQQMMMGSQRLERAHSIYEPSLWEKERELDPEGIRRGREEQHKSCRSVPARTDTKYWHNYCMKATEIRFVKGRLKFGQGKQTNSAPFPSAVVVFSGSPPPKISGMETMNREQRRALAKREKKAGNEEMAEKVALFGLIGDHCLVCNKTFDKKDREMVMSWNVVVREERRSSKSLLP